MNSTHAEQRAQYHLLRLIHKKDRTIKLTILSSTLCVSWLCSKWWGTGWSAPPSPPESRIPAQASSPARGSPGRAEGRWGTAAGRPPGWGSRCAGWCCGSWRETPWRWPPRGLGRTDRSPGPSGRSVRTQSNPSGSRRPECRLRRRRQTGHVIH